MITETDMAINAVMQPIAWLIVALLCSALYFLPTLIAWRRNHPEVLGVFMLNLLLGWTGIAWLAALFWGLSLLYRTKDLPATRH